jgi:prepilin-type processing-associated H-X9-DG protein
MSNLHQIGMAVRMYAEENEDTLPDSWKALLAKRNRLPPEALLCPGAKPGQQDYCFIVHEGPVKGSATTPMIFEPLGNHKMPGASVLFVDGHVEWVTPERYRKLLAPYIDSVD